MSVRKIALVGAAGNLGQNILRALLNDDFEVTILSRHNGISTDTFPNHPKQRIAKVNFDDVDSLIPVLQGIEAIISNIAGAAIHAQKTLVNAAVTAGVGRFIPSEFGMDLEVETNKTVPFYRPKIEINHYLEQTAKLNPNFSYTRICNGVFLDWSLTTGVLADLKNNTATLWDGGETRVSATTLASVGKAVVGVLNNPEATKNKVIRIHDTIITQKQILAIAEGIDGKTRAISYGDTAKAYQAALDELKKPNPDMRFAVFNQLYRTLFSVEHEPCFEDRVDNELVGLPLMTDEELRGIVERCMYVD